MSKRIRIVAIAGIATLLLAVSAIPAFALGNISGNQQVSVGYLNGSAVHITQQIPVQETIVTCTYPIDTSILVDENGGSYNDYDIVVGRGYYDYGGSSSSWGDFTQEIQVTYNDTSKMMNYVLPFNSLFDLQLEGRSFTTMLTLIAPRETIYIDYADLNNFLTNIGYGSNYMSLSATQRQSIKINWIVKSVNDLGKTVYKHENKTFAGSYSSDLLAQIQADFTDAENSGFERSDIIGISYYDITSTCTVESQTTNSNDGFLGFSISNNGTRRTQEEFTNQTPFGNIIGSETTEIIYNDQMDIGSVFSSIKDALSVDILGPISPMDILSIVIGLSLTIWVLKLIAGG